MASLMVGDEQRRRSAAALLGSALFIGGALVVVATAQLLPDEIDATPFLVAAAVAIATGVVIPFLPWHRWPTIALATLPACAYVLLGAAGWATDGALHLYLPLYGLTFLFLGLTQRPVVSAAMLPAASTSLFIGTGSDGESVAAIAIASPVWLAIGGVLSTVLDRLRRATAATEQLLAAAVALGQADEEPTAADLTASLAQSVLGADTIVVAVRERPGSDRLVVCASRGLELDQGVAPLDLHERRDGIAWALDRAAPLLVRDADAVRFTPRGLAGVPTGRALYLPLPGEGDQLGAIAAFWADRHDLAPTTTDAAKVLAAEAGRTLARVRDAARLAALADTDPVTNVPNRRRYQRALDAMSPGDAVVLLDMDHFKAVNDNHGHAAGDEVLRSFADCMGTVARDVDCVARYGGEEFAMILADAGVSGAQAALHRLRDAWAATEPPTTFSAGVAVHVSGCSPALTLAHADAALYQAKSNGRDCTEVADQADAER